MANPEHLQILQQGVEAWNAWRREHRILRPDLSGANFTNADLALADLTRANLSKADFTIANLTAADLTQADLDMADLGMADFGLANLTKAHLWRANLTQTDLTGANLSEARLLNTVFGETNLTGVEGLETCHHTAPSILDHRTLALSGPLPLAFLRGCGLPERFIEYLPSLLNEPFQFYSCFISYASKDHAFAERLHADRSRTSTLLVILLASKPSTMSLYHTTRKGHCDDSAPRLLPAGHCGMPLVMYHTSLYLAQRRRPSPSGAKPIRVPQVQTQTHE
jgi:Pentapeptide repeats (8 copies)